MNLPEPKTQRAKRVHVVGFVDSARTFGVTFQLRWFWTFVALGTCLALSLVALGLYSARKQLELHQAQNYIRELKLAIAAEAREGKFIETTIGPRSPQVASHVERASLHSGASRSNEASAQPAAARTAGSAGQQPLLALHAKAPSVPAPPTASPGSDDAEDDEDSADSPSSSAPATTGANTAAGQAPAPLPPPESRLFEPNKSPVKFDKFAVSESDDGSSAAVSFWIVKLPGQVGPQAGGVVSGRVCAVGELSGPAKASGAGEGGGSSTGASSQVVSYPEKLVMNLQHMPEHGCLGGLPVRLSRVRPSSLDLSIPANKLKSVKLFFEESNSGKLFEQSFPVEISSE